MRRGCTRWQGLAAWPLGRRVGARRRAGEKGKSRCRSIFFPSDPDPVYRLEYGLVAWCASWLMGQAVRLVAAYAGLLDWATGVMQFFYWGPTWWKNTGYNWCFVDHRCRLTPMRARSFATDLKNWTVYCQDGLSPISLLTEEEYHRAAPGGTGDIKTIGNYASVMNNSSRHSYGSLVTFVSIL